MDVAESKLRVVVDASEENLSCVIKTFAEASVTNVLNIGNIRSSNKLLQVSEIVGLGIGINQLGINDILLHGLASHLEVRNKFGPDFTFIRHSTNTNVFAGIFGVDERDDSFGCFLSIKLSLTELRPDRLFIACSGIRLGSVEIFHEVDKNTDCENLQLNLFFLVSSVLGLGKLGVNGETFFEKIVALGNANQSNVLRIKVVQLIDVSSNSGSIGTDGSKNKKVLKILVVRKVGSLKHNTFQKSNELSWKVSCHEGLYSARNFIRRGTFGKSPFNNLIDELAPSAFITIFLTVFFVENLRPQFQILAFDKVLGEIPEKSVFLADSNELVVAFTCTLLVSDECKLRIKSFAVWSQNLRIIKHVIQQESLRVTVKSDVDLSESIVSSLFRASGCDTGLEPWLKQTKTVSSLSDLNKIVDRAGSSNCHQNSLDEIFVSTEVEKLSNDLRGLGWRDLGHINFNVLEEAIQVEVFRKLINKVETIADVNERSWIRKLGTHEVFLDFFGDINVGVTANTFGFFELTQHARRLDIFEMNEGVFRKVDNCSKVVVKPFSCLVLFEDLDEGLRSKFFVVLLRDFDAHLHVLRSTTHHILEQRDALVSAQLAKIFNDEFGSHLMAVLENALNVRNFGEVLSCSLPHACSFAELRNVRLVVMSQCALLHDSISNLRSSANQVDFKQLRLKISVFCLVVLEGLQQESGSLLNTVATQECLSSLLNINVRAAFGTDQALCEVQRSRGIVEQKLAQHLGVVHLETNTR
mmetsp:Transcript_18555/g.45984  ORF Transcript_18555/g.45984 Transcript_18555/m.45984 type:complete len:754 (-) Transcript_18555:1697-3958(-)